MISNKTIWITGASSGIGEELAKQLAPNNRVVLSARRYDELKRVQNECDGKKEDIMVLPLDMAERTGMEAAMAKVKDRFGHIDIIVLNAGISNRSYIKDTKYDVFERLMEVNFFGNVALTQSVLPHFINQKSGHFVVISSLSGKFASPGRGAYSSSKHALHGFFDTLRMEHHHDNIKVTLVCPGFVQTNVTKNSLTSEGVPQGKLDKTTANGMPVDEACSRIINAVVKNKQEIAFGGKEKLGLLVKRFFPSLLTRIVLMSEGSWKINETVEK
jgi:short-subunit dehydrogenase